MQAKYHVVPMNDIREHISNGDPCPCLPRVSTGGAAIHNSYDGREVGEVCLRALDALGLALVGHNHVWSDREREAYEHATDLLNANFDVPDPDESDRV